MTARRSWYTRGGEALQVSAPHGPDFFVDMEIDRIRALLVRRQNEAQRDLGARRQVARPRTLLAEDAREESCADFEKDHRERLLRTIHGFQSKSDSFGECLTNGP